MSKERILEDEIPDYAVDNLARIISLDEPSPTVLTYPRGWNQLAISLSSRGGIVT